MLQTFKTWDFATRFVAKSRRLKRDDPHASRRLGVWTRERLVDLGPTFVKLGQLASTRRDLYSQEFIDELVILQDSVPAMEPWEVDAVLENEIPQGVATLFSEFDKTPFKSASLGQVHRGTLHSGVEVVVKLQRLGVVETISRDIDNVTDILRFFEFLGVDTGPKSIELFEEARGYIMEELDYVTEAQNAKRFYGNFYRTPWVKIPRVYTKFLTPRLMIMERVDGTKIVDVEDPQMRVRASKAFVTNFIDQIMYHGFFHGDPHPGNVALTPGGQLVLYDFGLCVDIDLELRSGLIALAPLIIQKDTQGVVDGLVDLGLIQPTSDRTEIVAFMDAALDYLEEMSGKEFNAKLAQDELSRGLAEDKPFLIPSDFLFLAKSFTTVDGICRQLDPKFSFLGYIQPLIDVDEIVESFDFQKVTRGAVEMPSNVRNISDTVKKLDRGRASVRRQIENTRRELRYFQLGIIAAILAENFQDVPVVPWVLGAVSAALVIRGVRT
jgi:ubiquinone biosynthesis protein